MIDSVIVVDAGAPGTTAGTRRPLPAQAAASTRTPAIVVSRRKRGMLTRYRNRTAPRDRQVRRFAFARFLQIVST